MRINLILLAIALVGIMPAAGNPEKLKPGEFEWHPERSPNGPLLIVCSLDDQLLYAFRNGVQIGRSTMTMGSKAKPATTGVFYVFQSDIDPAAKRPIVDSLPIMRQLSTTGVSIPDPVEARRQRIRDAIQVPPAFANKLYAQMRRGATVAVTRKNTTPVISNAPSRVLLELSAPVTGGRAIPKGRPFWEPEKSPTGPISILLSYADKTIYVWRSGIQIGQCPVDFTVPADRLPDGAFLMLDGVESPDPKHPGRAHRPWSVLSLSGATLKGDAVHELRDSTILNPDFSKSLNEALTPGTLFLTTHEARKPENQNRGIDIGPMNDLPIRD